MQKCFLQYTLYATGVISWGIPKHTYHPRSVLVAGLPSPLFSPRDKLISKKINPMYGIYVIILVQASGTLFYTCPYYYDKMTASGLWQSF